MVRNRQTDLGILFQEALRDRIGEKRYQTWFARDVRFVFDGDALTAVVDTPFMADWLNVEYRHIFEIVGREIFGRDLKVSFVTDASASGASGFPRSQSRAALLEPSEPKPAFDVPVPEPVAEPPKRKRGRPRKNPLPEPVAVAPIAPPAPEPLFDLPTAFDPPVATSDALARLPRAPFQTDPPKRKRGRPRKNPLPAPASESIAKPSYVGFDGAAPPPLADPRSFFDAFQAEREREVRELPASTYAELSESERVARALGEFDVPAPSPANLLSPSAPTEIATPRRRGRPRKNPVQTATPLFDESDAVFRDERGYTVVTRPKEPTRVKTPVGRLERFASLDSFVEGFSNRLALRVAGVAIAEPGAMNPVFVSGPTSVGKTHLLEGVCDAYLRLPDAKPPLYMTSEQFTSAFVQSLRGGSPFRDRFKNISLFALDDLHFLEGKISTQTELLNVVDYLRVRRVQMIFTANRPLRELSKLRGELVARLESGMICKIDNPERETLARIMSRMALERNMSLPDEVSRYVVSRFATHARQISGALNRLLAAQLATGAPIDLDLAREALADLAEASVRTVKLDDVERVVQEVFGLEPNSLKSSSRAKRCADPRAVAMWFARKRTRLALSEIGKFFGGRKHSAVLSAQKKVDEWIRLNAPLDAGDVALNARDAIDRVERELALAR
ncbi:MAG: hypothetical protein IJM30_11500 [Thermoguttaceae bacterium]|nr:hypothetical protein [Thermoguttaceae bacterium]